MQAHILESLIPPSTPFHITSFLYNVSALLWFWVPSSPSLENQSDTLWLCATPPSLLTPSKSPIAVFGDCDSHYAPLPSSAGSSPSLDDATKLSPSESTVNEEKRVLLRSILESNPPDDYAHPAHLVSIGRYVTDSELPGFSIDWDRLEVSVDWKAMFTALLLEERLRTVLRRRWVSLLDTSLPSASSA